MIISIGVTIQTIYADFEIFIDDHFMSPPTLMVAIGILLLLVSSFGCVGAIRESTMLINVVSNAVDIIGTYSVFLSVMNWWRVKFDN